MVMPRPTRCVPHTRLWLRRHEICAKLCPVFRGLYTGSLNAIARDGGYTPPWSEGSGLVETGILKPGARLEQIIDEAQVLNIKKGDLSWLGRWASEDPLPNRIQPARDATAVKRVWKDERKRPLYKVILEVKHDTEGVITRRGYNASVYDEQIGRRLRAGVVQHEFIDRESKFGNLKIIKIAPLIE